ncbi:MAG: tRNA (adenosine(37)-N6)-threonylcarbamoyltransferase complex ATPase subunit type 1 TsaE [Gammaproteobacteria bacterium]|nr:tRNA (adenosine(37)-N6)-threonylcarbamoyltransferase complex ATPase subunit type 1 TsaE [Gammaproteobacteria bacterium]
MVYQIYIYDDINITSPTFPIINEYITDNYKIFHYDLYRIKSHKELLEIGIDSYLNQNALHFFEWPNEFKSLLPKPNFEINLDVIDESRILKIITNHEKE